MSPLNLDEVLVVLVDRLTLDAKYPVHDCENMLLPIQMQFSEKRKIFSEFFFPFWNLKQIVNILKKRMIVIANVFPKLKTVKILLRLLSKNNCLRTRFDSQHVKRSQILAKSP